MLKLQKLKSKVKDIASSVGAYAISKPFRQLRGVQKQVDADVAAIKADRAIRDMPIEPADHTNPAFRTRVNAIQARLRTERRRENF